jgi:chloride channel protein, CIC family
MSAMRAGVHHLRDFTIDPAGLAFLTGAAVLVGVLAACIAKLLLMLIGFITQLAYAGSVGDELMAPDPHRFGPVAILIPIVGGIIVGLIARFGTEKIRGHGIPEALGSILENRSIMQARVAFWKPIASAVAIGTGGPFGAEGPIIMSGGAFGSLCAQFLRLSSLERRTLLVAGASAGMAATFGAPIASVLIAVELLLFEWRPRSYVPVAAAAFAAEIVRLAIIAPNPPFLIGPVAAPPSLDILWALGLGLAGGIVSMILTRLVYACEDLYHHLPVHWMWWPAIGGAAVGIGGWFVPQALGVGYPTIAAMAAGKLAIGVVAGIIVVKIAIWVISLSSGTSGGVLAPLLMIGGALGVLFAALDPNHQVSVWAIAGMAALMGGTMRAPFMGTLFALETTHAWAFAPVVFVACVAATAFTVVFVPRSILTEKLARRGIHVARDYSAHPLEFVSVSQVMHAADLEGVRPPVSIGIHSRVRSAIDTMARRRVRELSVLDDAQVWVGTLTLEDVLPAWRKGLVEEERRHRVRWFVRRR